MIYNTLVWMWTKLTAILAVVEKDNHAIGVHGLAGEELPVLEGADNLLGEGLSTSLELLDLLVGGVVGLHLLLDGLHVVLEGSTIFSGGVGTDVWKMGSQHLGQGRGSC
jgi:hypothetical protein